MLRTIPWVVVLLAAAVPSWAAGAPYSIKTATTPAPKEIKEPIAKLLSEQSLQLLDDKGAAVGEFWFRKEVPSKATPAQVKNGLTYRELDETTLLGAVRFDRQVTDYRKQKINPGVYTVRLGFQPMDGDHMGTSPHPEFGLLVPAAADEKPDPLANAKELQEASSKAVVGSSSHPAVFLLVPVKKVEEAPKLSGMGGGKWVLYAKADVKAGDQKAALGIGLTVVGHAD
jgi:hypothetical protein